MTVHRMHRFALFAATSLAGIVVACGGGGGTGTTAPAFHLSTSDPMSGDAFVPLQKVLRLTFNKPVDPATVTATTLTVEAQGAAVQPTGVTQIDVSGGGTRLLWTHLVDFPGGLHHT